MKRTIRTTSTFSPYFLDHIPHPLFLSSVPIRTDKILTCNLRKYDLEASELLLPNKKVIVRRKKSVEVGIVIPTQHAWDVSFELEPS